MLMAAAKKDNKIKNKKIKNKKKETEIIFYLLLMSNFECMYSFV